VPRASAAAVGGAGAALSVFGDIASLRADNRRLAERNRHLAAELAKDRIEPPRLLRAARRAEADADVLVCEGVGGLMVPLAPGYLVRDFARELGLPVIVAAPPDLGTINHTLLTLEAARAAGLDVALVVLTPWPEDPDPIQSSNRRTLESLGGVPVAVLRLLDLNRPDSWPQLDVPVGETGAGSHEPGQSGTQPSA